MANSTPMNSTGDRRRWDRRLSRRDDVDGVSTLTEVDEGDTDGDGFDDYLDDDDDDDGVPTLTELDEGHRWRALKTSHNYMSTMVRNR